MTLQQQMIAANIRNWLSDLATGVKAMHTKILCAPCDKLSEYRYEVSCYDYNDCFVDGMLTVYIHEINVLAEAAELDIQHRDFVSDDKFYRAFSGEDFIVFNDVKFSQLILRKEKLDEGE